jgi:hypothetical protein
VGAPGRHGGGASMSGKTGVRIKVREPPKEAADSSGLRRWLPTTVNGFSFSGSYRAYSAATPGNQAFLA